ADLLEQVQPAFPILAHRHAVRRARWTAVPNETRHAQSDFMGRAPQSPNNGLVKKSANASAPRPWINRHVRNVATQARQERAEDKAQCLWLTTQHSTLRGQEVRFAAIGPSSIQRM